MSDNYWIFMGMRKTAVPWRLSHGNIVFNGMTVGSVITIIGKSTKESLSFQAPFYISVDSFSVL